MKIRTFLLSAALLFLPTTALADPFDSVESCHRLRIEVEHAASVAAGIDNLLTSPDLTAEQFLSQLYEGVKILSSSGEMFFRASDENESACKDALHQQNAIGEFIVVYDLYLKPVKQAYQFFRRAREAAVRLNRQNDVDAFNAAMTEYDDAIMKLADNCRSVMGDSPAKAQCASLSARLSEALE